ncbi:MAG: hypothetical protein V4638_07075 [Bacteroidota bacterium]
MNYEPTGQIVCFHWDSLFIYTDTTSLFAVYDNYGTRSDYDRRIKQFVRKQIQVTTSDTAIFIGEFIPLNDGFGSKTQEKWYIEWCILNLLKDRKLKIYDKEHQLVQNIVKKKVKNKKNGFEKLSYINKATKKELFYEVTKFRSMGISF